MGVPVNITQENNSGEFVLYANDESGVALINETGKEISNLSIKAEGQWDGGAGLTGPEGNQNWSGDKSKLKYPSYVPFSLIGVNNGNHNDVRQISQGTGVTLAAGTNLTLVMNDIPNTYCENQNYLTITWST